MFSKTSIGKAALLGAIAGALGLGLVASSAVAAPVGGVAPQIEPTSLVDKVHCGFRHRFRRAGFVTFGFRPWVHPFGFRTFGFRRVSRLHCHSWGCHRH
jgi:hypothetical protein